MRIDERMMEAAEANVRRECDNRVAAIRASLREEGEDVCVVCDEPIGAARLAVLPSAERCFDCQCKYEREVRGHRGR